MENECTLSEAYLVLKIVLELMMKIVNKKFGYTLAAVSLGLLVFASTIATGWVTNAANAQQVAPENAAIIPQVPPVPVLSSAEEQALFEIAKNVPGVKAWAANGWQYLGTDFLGTEKPAKWTHGIVNMKLPPTAQAQTYCSEGWDAMVTINLETKQVEDADFPSVNDQCDAPGFGRASETIIASGADSIIPQAFGFGANGYEIARQEDVSSWFDSYYGNLVYMKTPSISSSIYSNMNWWVAHLLNADLGSGKFLQTGWVVTKPAFPQGTGIGANSKAIVYVDEFFWGNTHPHNTNLAWANGVTALVEHICQPSTQKYGQQIIYNGNVWVHFTNISCSTKLVGDVNDNSVWIENKNTAPYNNWHLYITSAVQADDAYEAKNSSDFWVKWTSSSNKKVSCGAISPSNVITGTLANLGLATWSSLQYTPYAC